MRIKVALYKPEIPQNTGNIGRLCVGFQIPLVIIDQPAFEISDRSLKRAGLDYWPHLDFKQYPDFKNFFENHTTWHIVCISKFGTTALPVYSFQDKTVLLFGRETTGVPEAITNEYQLNRVRLPMPGRIRSYNLANSTAMAVYEAHRQLEFKP